MNTKAIFYTAAALSFCTNYLTLPIAAPVYAEAIKQATANHLMHLASDLHPQKPTYIPAVQQEVLEKAENGKPSAMPDKLPIEQIAQRYPAANSDIIRELLEAN